MVHPNLQYSGPEGNRTPDPAMRMPCNTTLLRARGGKLVS